MGFSSPEASSAAYSFSSASTARAASSFFTANDVVFSLEACDTMNTLTPSRARALNMRAFIPTIPTIPRPDTVIRQVSLIDDIPLMALPSEFPSEASLLDDISVPFASGLKVFLSRIGMFL